MNKKALHARWISCTIAVLCFGLIGDHSVVSGQDLLFTLLPTSEAYQLEVQEGYSVATCQQYHVVGKPIAAVGSSPDAGAVEVYDATTNLHIATLNNPAPSPDDRFGTAVAASGNFIVVGAEKGDTGGHDTGSAYVYDLTVAGTSPMYELANPFPDGTDRFGRAVAIDANILVVGANTDDTGASDAGSAYVYDLNSANPELPVAILNNPDQQSDAYFGHSVSVSGQIVVVGAASDDTGAKNAGSAYVYDLASAEPEVPIVILRNPTPEDYDRFGGSVSVSGNIIVVSAFGEDQETGTVYVYDLQAADIETPVYELANPKSHILARFGETVAIFGGIIVVGAPEDSPGGKSFVFDLGASDPESPILQLDNPAPNPLDRFGNSVSVWSDNVIVGAPCDDTFGLTVGLSYSYNLQAKNPDVPTAILSHPSPPITDLFGRGLSAWENVVVVGAPGDDSVSPDAGRVYVYDTTSDHPEDPILLIDNPGTGNQFGRAIANWDNFIAVSNFAQGGRVYIYDLNAMDPTIPSLIINNPTPESGDTFGISLSIREDILVVGDSHDNTGAFDAGSAYVYDLDSAFPDTPILTLHNPMPAVADRFGTAVANFGSLIVVGASYDDSAASDSGTAFVYDMSSANPELPFLTLPNPSPASNERFGDSVSVSCRLVVVGCPGDKTDVLPYGAVYVYDLASDNPGAHVKIANPQPGSDDEFGNSVAVFGNNVLIGAVTDDTSDNYSGAAFLFNLSGPSKTPYTVFQSPTPYTGDRFGESVVISGNQVVISAPFDDTRVLDSGAVYIFDFQPTHVHSDEYDVIRGLQISGALCDTFESDDSYLKFNPGLTLNSSEAPVWLIFDATLPSDSPISLRIVMESNVGTPGLTHTLEAWNWTSAAYDVIDVSMANFNNDVVVTVDLSSNISDYVESGTVAVRTRVGWRKTGFTINYPWEVRLDQMVWIVQ